MLSSCSPERRYGNTSADVLSRWLKTYLTFTQDARSSPQPTLTHKTIWQDNQTLLDASGISPINLRAEWAMILQEGKRCTRGAWAFESSTLSLREERPQKTSSLEWGLALGMGHCNRLSLSRRPPFSFALIRSEAPSYLLLTLFLLARPAAQLPK